MSRTNRSEPGLAPGFLVAAGAPPEAKGALQATSGHGWLPDGILMGRDIQWRCINAPAGESQTDRGLRDALSEAEAYVGGKCAVECVRDALRREAENLDEVVWYARAQDFSEAAGALDALNQDDAP